MDNDKLGAYFSDEALENQQKEMEKQLNKQEYYSNFQCFDSKKRRKAVFGRKTESGKLEIFEITCSLNDEYNKQYPKNIYKRHLEGLLYGGCHPIIHYKDIKEGDSVSYTFNQHCKENYYHLIEQNRTYKEIVLKKINEKPVILSSKRYYKMDKTY